MGRFPFRKSPGKQPIKKRGIKRLSIKCPPPKTEVEKPTPKNENRFWGGAFLLTVGAFMLTVKLLCLQSVEVLLRHTLPLQAKKLNCKLRKGALRGS